MKALQAIIFTVVAAAALSPSALQACATCFGASDEPMARGMNMGIMALLFCITGVLLGMVGVGIFFARRAARMPAVAPVGSPGDVALPAGQTLK